MDLFEQRYQRVQEEEAPLAARMRPRSLEEFIGQEHILAPGRLLRRAIQADRLSSSIFYGPPGTGKTTLARAIANTTRAHFLALNAVLAGIKDLRAATATATEQLKLYNRRTILFVDEVHRFNKSQQDALLPWVENGTVILIGATTENPYFEVNKALVSRSRLFQLLPLEARHLEAIAQQALTTPQRGYGQMPVILADDARTHLVDVANGDARALLNAIELAVETTPPAADGTIHITLAIAEESIQQRAVLYDKEGDVHFDTISAFIKSVRGSDADAALYWLARMVYAGEDPRFIFRRLLILASEDVGLADPQAIAVVNACAAAFDRVGLPEGRYPLAQATLYLATAPKSNSVMGFFEALATVERERAGEIPNPLKDANRDKKGFGHGAGYLYPHAYRDHWVAQQYLPAGLQGRAFYQPSAQGYEGDIAQQVSRRREAQLAAAMEGLDDWVSPGGLTYSEPDRSTERWLQRSLGEASDRLAGMRERLFELAQPQRHHVLLVFDGESGLLTWEAVRRVPEGGVYACVPTPQTVESLVSRAVALPEEQRPTIWSVSPQEVSTHLAECAPNMRCDRILGRNVLMPAADKSATASSWLSLLADSGAIALAENIPREGQRIYQFLSPSQIGTDLYKKWADAEEAIYAPSSDDPLLNWGATDLRTALEKAGYRVSIEIAQMATELYVSPALLQRWLAPAHPDRPNRRPSYLSRLAEFLTPTEVQVLQRELPKQLQHRTVTWQNAIAFCCCRKLG
ncbi:MAG: AAA family ATPase [Cyanobacteria bacterium J06641_5]